jgi:hypothetical protein
MELESSSPYPQAPAICVILPLETLSPEDPNGGVVSPEEASLMGNS